MDGIGDISLFCLCATTLEVEFLPPSPGEDLVSEQTRQRKEDKQEEAARFPAALHVHLHPACPHGVQ